MKLWVFTAHNTPHSSEQVLEAVWTKFEVLTSPRSRLRPKKTARIAILMRLPLLLRTFWASVGDIIRNGCSQHLIHTRTSVTYTLDQVWTNNEPYKSTYVQKTATTVTFTDILSVLWVISLVMAAHSTPHSSEQVLETVWTKFEPITSPTSRLRPEKQPESPFWRNFRYFYGHFEHPWVILYAMAAHSTSYTPARVWHTL